MLPDRVSNPGPLAYESGALPIAPRGPAKASSDNKQRTSTITPPTFFTELFPFEKLTIGNHVHSIPLKFF